MSRQRTRIRRVILGGVVAVAVTLALPTTAWAATYGERSIDFERWAYGSSYTSSMFSTDFGNGTFNDTASVLGPSGDQNLKMLMKAGQTGSGGVQARATIADATAYTLTYDIKFDDNYDWTKGGKLPGLCGGDCNTGGDPATDGLGWSVRLMWEGPTSTSPAGLRPYVYHRDMPGTYGDDFDPDGQGVIATIQDNTWYRIRVEVGLNSGSNRDGTLRVYVNGTLAFEKTNIRYRTDGRPINSVLMHVFHGGSTADYYPAKDQYIRIDDLSWR